MCDPRTQSERKEPRTVPVKTQAVLGRSKSLEKRQWASGSSFPASRLRCGPEPQAARTRGVAGRAAQRRLVPRVRPAPTPGEEDRDPGTTGGTQRARGRRHTAAISQEGKPGNVAPGEIAEHVHSATCYTLGGPRDQRKRPDCFPAPSDTARPRHASLAV